MVNMLSGESMDEAIATVNEIASEHLELVTKNPFETMTRSATREQFLSGNIPVNHWVIISPVQTMCCRQTELQNFSHRLAWMILSKSQALSLIQERH